jgi:hypothetical protein
VNLSRPADANPNVLRYWRRLGYPVKPSHIRAAEEEIRQAARDRRTDQLGDDLDEILDRLRRLTEDAAA